MFQLNSVWFHFNWYYLQLAKIQIQLIKCMSCCETELSGDNRNCPTESNISNHRQSTCSAYIHVSRSLMPVFSSLRTSLYSCWRFVTRPLDTVLWASLRLSRSHLFGIPGTGSVYRYFIRPPMHMHARTCRRTLARQTKRTLFHLPTTCRTRVRPSHGRWPIHPQFISLTTVIFVATIEIDLQSLATKATWFS